MVSIDLQEAYKLLSRPQKTVAVLDYISRHSRVVPATAAKELRLDLRTWYAALEQLERLGFATVERVPGGKKARRFRLTHSGKLTLEYLRAIAPLVENSRAALEWELKAGRVERGSEQAGEDLCRLLEIAERRGDFDELKALARIAAEWGRPGEAALAHALHAFLRGESVKAREGTTKSMQTLDRVPGSHSYLKALHTHAATLEYAGESARAFEAFTQLRTQARQAGDSDMEAEAWLGTAVLKGRRTQFKDAAEHIERGLDCARSAGNQSKEAKLLANLCYVELFLDPARALKTSDKALHAARASGSTLIVARTQLNRSLILAIMGDKHGALESLGEARAHLREGGEERGTEAVENWAREIRWIVRSKSAPPTSEWQERIIKVSMAGPEGRSKVSAPEGGAR